MNDEEAAMFGCTEGLIARDEGRSYRTSPVNKVDNLNDRPTYYEYQLGGFGIAGTDKAAVEKAFSDRLVQYKADQELREGGK